MKMILALTFLMISGSALADPTCAKISSIWNPGEQLGLTMEDGSLMKLTPPNAAQAMIIQIAFTADKPLCFEKNADGIPSSLSVKN